MNILQSIDDPALFHGMFPSKTWGPWRVFLAALFAIPMDDDQCAVYSHHTGRETPPAEPFREAALICGRRGGKSRVLALIAVYLSAFRDYRSYIVPGEVPTVAIVAADRRQAKVILRYAIGLMPELVPPLLEEGGPEPPAGALLGRHQVGFFLDGVVQRLETAFWDLERLRAGNVVYGPAIVQQMDSTTVVNPGLEARVDRYGNVVIDTSKGRG